MAALDSAELTEWQAYDLLEPLGEGRADLRMGILAALTANIHRGKGVSPYKPADFIPDFAQHLAAPREQSVEEMKRTVELLNKALGGKDLRGKR